MARFRWGYGVVRNGAWEKRVTALHRPTAVAQFLLRSSEGPFR